MDGNIAVNEAGGWVLPSSERACNCAQSKLPFKRPASRLILRYYLLRYYKNPDRFKHELNEHVIH